MSIPTPWKAIGNSEVEGFPQPKFRRQSMKFNWEFQGGRENSNKKPSMLEVWIFSGTTHFVSGLEYVYSLISTEFIY